MRTEYLLIENIAEHSGFVTEVDLDDDSWTYQQITGPHGRVTGNFSTEEEANKALEKAMQCDSVEKDEYCYTHNPR